MKLKVMLLDDEKAFLLTMKMMLSKINGVEIVGTFQKGEEALRCVQRQRTDIFLIDINMPEENGIEFAKKLRKIKPHLTLVFLTAHKEYALEAFSVYAFDYLIKPVSLKRLEQTMKRVHADKMDRDLSKFLLSPERNKASIHCMGGMIFKTKTGEMVSFISAKSKEVLGYLLLQRGEFANRHVLIDKVFEGMTPKSASIYLNTAIYQLRKALEPHGLKNIIITAGDGYQFDNSQVYVDFIDLEKRIQKLNSIEQADLDEAINVNDIYKGNLFGEHDYHWSILESERINSVYSDFAKRLAGRLMDCGKTDTACSVLKKLVQHNDLDEGANYLLLQLYAEQKDRISFIKHYNKYSQLLREELGIKPGREIDKLYREITAL